VTEPNAGGLSLVLPTYNSGDLIGGRLPALTQTLRDHFDEVEVIVVDDASDAAFQTYIDQCAADTPGLRVLRNTTNLGKGASVLLGIEAARKPHVIFTDADVPFDAESYARVAAALHGGEAAVIGCRRRHESQMLARFDALGYAASRHVIGVTFNKAVRALTGLPFADTQCGLKGFRRDVALQLFRRVHHARFLFDIELLLAATRTDTPVAEVPVCVIYEDSRTTVSVGFESWRFARDLIGLWRRVRRGEYDRDPEETLLDRVASLSHEVTSTS
jgi:glycosyltransferase involved in cell wall biosynthesis